MQLLTEGFTNRWIQVVNSELSNVSEWLIVNKYSKDDLLCIVWNSKKKKKELGLDAIS